MSGFECGVLQYGQYTTLHVNKIHLICKLVFVTSSDMNLICFQMLQYPPSCYKHDKETRFIFHVKKGKFMVSHLLEI